MRYWIHILCGHWLSTPEMDYIHKHHLHAQRKKSIFVSGENIRQLVKEVLTHPLIIRPYETKPRQWWYMRKFSRVIRYRGIDKANVTG